jgi:hypothetical protein
VCGVNLDGRRAGGVDLNGRRVGGVDHDGGGGRCGAGVEVIGAASSQTRRRSSR